MAYFSNATEAEIWKEENCYRCGNYENHKIEGWEELGCPVEMVHFLFCYDAQSWKNEGRPLPMEILDLLIPRGKNGIGAGPCSMFREQTG